MGQEIIHQNDVVIIELTGRMDAESANDAEIELTKLIDEGKRKILFDLAGLDYISSAGLRVLLAVTKKLGDLAGEVKIAGVKNYVKEVFDITGFTPIFDLYDSREDASRSFS